MSTASTPTSANAARLRQPAWSRAFAIGQISYWILRRWLRPGLVEGTRELVVVGLPYVIVYRLAKGAPDTIDILGIYHGAQNRSKEPPEGAG